ncbi:hypothetical protein ACT4US_29340, partial [Bacillus sp. HC-Mk]
CFLIFAASPYGAPVHFAISVGDQNTFVSGNGVPHMHIIPRYANTPKEFWSPTEIAKWTGAPYGDAAKIKKLCERIREYMVSEYAYNK